MSERHQIIYMQARIMRGSGPSDIAEMYKAERKNAEVRCGL